MGTYVNQGEGGSGQSEHLPINFWKAYPDRQKEKGIQKWVGIGVKKWKKSRSSMKRLSLN